MLKLKSLIVPPLFFLLAFLSSCHGQEKENPRERGLIKVESSSSSSSKEGKETYIDPLFYIDGQLCAWVRNMFQDKRGDLWFGTNHYGVMRYDGDTLEYFAEKQGFEGGRITEIIEDEKGDVWFGKYGGISKYDGKTFTDFTEKDGLVNDEVWSVLLDQKGIFWIGTSEGISRFDGKTFTTFSIPKAVVKDTTSIVSYNRISCILEDRNGVIWFGTDGFGICKYDARLEEGLGAGKAFSHITKEDGLCDNNISSMMEDQKGNIWIGTMYGGVSRLDASLNDGVGTKMSWTNFTKDGWITGVEISDFYEDKNESIWFGAENHGVYRYDARLDDGIERGKAFTNFYKKEKLNTNGILAIYEDKEGRFWFGGWGGLFRYDGTSFSAITKDGPWQ